MKRLCFLITIFICCCSDSLLFGQQIPSFTLEEAVQYALTNNYGIRNSQTDVAISKKKVQEMTALGLPQISASASYTNFLELPTSLIPGEFLQKPPGTFIA
jgi:outer membrane protein TolC